MAAYIGFAIVRAMPPHPRSPKTPKSRKQVKFAGSSLDDLREFPKPACQEVGQEIARLQVGLKPSNWKPMTTIGPGASEIRVHDESGAYRVIYVAKFADAIHILHCFQKKTQKTSASDLEIARTRYAAVAAEDRRRNNIIKLEKKREQKDVR